jgi:DNA-binding MarR family transcriptional regulator
MTTTFVNHIHPLTGLHQSLFRWAPPQAPKPPAIWATKREIVDTIKKGYNTARKIANHLKADTGCVSAELLKMSRAGVVSRRMKWCTEAKASVWQYAIGEFVERKTITQTIREYIAANPDKCAFDVAEALGMLNKNVSSKMSSMEQEGVFISVRKPSKTRRACTKFYSLKGTA